MFCYELSKSCYNVVMIDREPSDLPPLDSHAELWKQILGVVALGTSAATVGYVVHKKLTSEGVAKYDEHKDDGTNLA